MPGVGVARYKRAVSSRNRVFSKQCYLLDVFEVPGKNVSQPLTTAVSNNDNEGDRYEINRKAQLL